MLLALPGGAAAADKPSNKTLYYEGPSGRYLMDGTWLFRLDPGNRGISSGWNRSRGTAGWSRVTVPSVWNVGDDSPASMVGGVGWYRKDFTVPEASRALEWAVRFESVNYRSRVWLNGKRVGSNAGAYIPFELRLRDIKRHGTNRLVIRVDSRHRGTDFPPAGRTADGRRPAAGGTTRASSARSTSSASTAWTGRPCAVIPRLACPSCPARVQVRATVRNVKGSAERVRITGRFGSRRLSLGSGSVSGGGTRSFTTTIRVPQRRSCGRRRGRTSTR